VIEASYPKTIRSVAMSEGERCQFIFLNLLRLRKHIDLAPAAYIREFFQTERCDGASDLRHQRDAYRRFLGPESSARIAKYDETRVDERRAAHAVMHYSTFDASLLAKSLTWPNWIMYYTQ